LPSAPKSGIRLYKSGYHFYRAKYREMLLTQI